MLTGTVCEELPLEENIVTVLTTVPLHEKIIVKILTAVPLHEKIIVTLLTTVPLFQEIFFASPTTVRPRDEKITGSTATAVRTSSTATTVPTSDTATAVLTSKEACTRPRHRRLKKQQYCDRRGFPDAVTSKVLPESAALVLVIEVASA